MHDVDGAGGMMVVPTVPALAGVAPGPLMPMPSTAP